MSSPGLTLPQPQTEAASREPQSCIHECFEAQVSRTPDAIALSFQGENYTYRELNERANRLAHRLRELGVGPEVPVALYLERTPKAVIAIIAVLKAGGAYLPIDLAYPPERIAFMLEDARPPVVLTQESLRGALPAGTPGVISFEQEVQNLGGQSTQNPANCATSENLAYIIYTSGSTGKPKGVLVTHHNVVRLLRQTAPWYRFDGSDVWPWFHSYAFDVSVWELWGSLFFGGRLVVVPYLTTRSPSEFYDLLAREKVTVLNQTPSAFRQLIWAEAAAVTKHELNLRYVICAGEALELQSLKPWFERHGDQRPQVFNMYGITETTVHSTFRVIRQSDLTNGMGSVIGVPIPDLQIHLVDEDLKPVPAGVPGEICVGGAGVARGYLKRPELTSRRFLPDPFSTEPGALMYRSGDLAQINARGELEYLGRMDHQVKIRGFRVELGEIESALNACPGIRESVVVALDGSGGDKRLTAYVVPINQPPTVSALRAGLAKLLPDYMVPAAFVFLKALPLTTNGKVDRRALPNPDGTRPELSAEFVAPRNDVEQTLARIWCDVLELDRVGANDNFFELGGDSIRSIRILSQAQQCGLHLNLQQIFQNPTIAGLAACATSDAPKSDSAPTAPFALISAADRAKLPPGVEDAYPVTRLQFGMFFHNELNPVSAMYHDVFSYRVEAAFDAPKLEQALAELMRRHPLLRTSFHLAGYSEPLQFVHEQAPVRFEFEDVRSIATAGQEARITQWIEEEKRRPFDRSVAPLFRFHAQWLSNSSFQFIVSFHHCCLDGWSLAALVTEVLQEYASLLADTPCSLPAPRIAYRNFVTLERQAMLSPDCHRFWEQKLDGAEARMLPRWPRRMRAGGAEQVRGPEIHLEPQVLSALKALAHTARVPLKSVLLAAHQRVLALLYGQTDVVSGLISNGRPEELDGERILGLFLNTLPLRQNLRGGTWLDLVKETFAAEQEILPHRRFPVSEIQKLTAGKPVFETAFDFVHFHVLKNLQSAQNLALTEGPYFEANNLTAYTTFMLDVDSARLELHIDYDPNELCRQQVEEMTQYYVRTLQAMAADPRGRYETFSPLSEVEQRRLLCEWNHTREEYPRGRCLHELFAEQAKATPDAVALVFRDQALTYRELNARADLLAAELRRQALPEEALVGVCLKRSPQMVIALLAVLKAGAAYVPLDPTYPAERLDLMLRDSQAPVIITRADLAQSLPPTQARLVLVDDSAPAAAQTAGLDASLAAAARAEALAYVIYTSGSTGQPKGVQVTHGAVVNLLTSVARRANVTSRDTLLAVTTLSFDIAALEIFLPLITGGRLVLADRETAADGSRLGALLSSCGATLMQATPATWRLLLETGWQGKEDLKIFCGGEALKRELADQLLPRAAEVWNFYGPTETTIWSAAWKVAPGEPVRIGRPLANTQFYILDSHLQLLPVGATGELYIGGAGLAHGYLNRPDLTTEKFIPNPFADAESQRLYQTGDLARYLPDGTVECLGRRDHQVKIRGFRIELGEVETVLRQHSTIAEALVTARDDAHGEKRLVGYIRSRNGPPSPADLRAFMQTKLPAYMVPAQFVLLKQFPQTPNGKIDLRALPAPGTGSEPDRPRCAPRSDEEQAVAAIWREVLELNEPGIDDNFFDLGGDSLSATRVFARINRAFGMNLTLREILDHPTIRSLGELVAGNKGTAPAPRPALRRYPRPPVTQSEKTSV